MNDKKIPANIQRELDRFAMFKRAWQNSGLADLTQRSLQCPKCGTWYPAEEKCPKCG